MSFINTPGSRTAIGMALAIAAGVLSSTPALAQNGSFPGGEKAIERMREADTNHDGVISRAELINARKTNWQRMDRNHDGYFSKDDLPRFVQSRWDSEQLVQLRKEFDTNHDGRLSYNEFVNGPTVGFDLADTDHNGLVTKAELEAMSAKIKAQRG